jgi:ketosteroid isomerase-like protein
MTTATAIDAWYAALQSGKTDGLATVCTPDVTLNWIGQPDLIPWAGQHRGLARIAAFLAAIHGPLRLRLLDIKERMETPGVTVVTLNGRWMCPATELDLMARQVDIFRFREGKIAAIETLTDSLAFCLLVGKLKRPLPV